MPASLVSVLRSVPVSVLRMATVAAGTVAPVASLTVPVMLAEPESWPKARVGKPAPAASMQKMNRREFFGIVGLYIREGTKVARDPRGQASISINCSNRFHNENKWFTEI